ncbi:MAG: cation:proton antiporter [Prolixibacteraceae bacterium]|jgi:multicomponent Na+:H+ antiporter subunit F|nr:cation:proton antiporter [Prolixibacteraceae bacterium]MBT6763211.1 cation:proton antiporter [Prolixibacteraceae bacterium]MBT6998297.1 cation:proton antiporter [Prolixibacteraceae bacterium]MBT7396457.1 cation:proton antiporter [Prolixibacteraceae bacterium]
MVNIILQIAGGIMLLSLVLSLYRFFKAGSLVDRVIAFDIMTIISISLIAMITHISGRTIYIDVALIYGLLSFLGVVIVARYLEKSL